MLATQQSKTVSTPPSSFSSSQRKPATRIRSTAEFAKYVGLARTTVSRVLNDQPGLKEATVTKGNGRNWIYSKRLRSAS